MCGIQGAFNIDLNPTRESQQHRGPDACNTTLLPNGSITHNLLAIHGRVEQPLTTTESVLAANCEIYNHKALGTGRNDADTLHQHLEEHGVTPRSLNDLDGVYALAYYDHATDELVLARDLLGVKPLWYYYDGNALVFASEKKTLLNHNLPAPFIEELHPRHILTYNAKQKTLTTQHRPFFKHNVTDTGETKAIKEAAELIEKAVEKRSKTDKKIGVLFSGGIDSALIAHTLKRLGKPFHAYYGGLPGSKEEQRARQTADQLDIPLTVCHVDVTSEYVADIVNTIDDNNYIKVSVAAAYHEACKQASRDGCKIVFSGTGAEEAYGGYKRQKKSTDLTQECLSGLRRKYYRDLYRDDCIAMHSSLELRIPFLDHDVIQHALSTPHEYKTSRPKALLRNAAKHLGLPQTIVDRKKTAAQYGSGTAQALQSLAKQHNQYVGEYLAENHPVQNTRLAALISTGKDSMLATQRSLDNNYDIECFVTIQPENKDSYMTHGPNTNLAELQARASNKPLITQQSKGEKEKELQDYKEALTRAKHEYHVEGVVTGAIRSEYQRQRIERIADRVGLKTYAPLWHQEETSVLSMLVNRGFDVVLVKTAAYGLDETWIGKHIKPHTIQAFRELRDDYGVNPAGEGGEYESLVLSAPFMKKRIELTDTETVKRDEYVHELVVHNARLTNK
jgi:asparagine synthase (glutamine-hydrolysing)